MENLLAELPLSIAGDRSEWAVERLTILAFLPPSVRLRVGDESRYIAAQPTDLD